MQTQTVPFAIQNNAGASRANLRISETALIVQNQPETFTAEWHRGTDSSFDRTTDSFLDATIYQTAAYARLRMRGLPTARLTMHQGSQVVAAAVARLYRVPLLPIGLALVSFGPLWRRAGETQAHGDNLEVLRQTLLELRNRISGRMGLQLIIKPNIYETDPLAEAIAQTFHDAGYTQEHSSGLTPLMNLDRPLEELRAGIHQKWRNRLNVAERKGLTVTVSSSAEDFAHFHTLYQDLRRRKQYQSSENLPQALKIFTRMDLSIRPRVILCWNEGRPISGAIFSTRGATAFYLFGATTEEGMRLYASRIIQWNIVAHAHSQGCTQYDLGGTSEKDPHFKGGLVGKNGTDVKPLGPFTAPGSKLNQTLLRLSGRRIVA